MRSPRLVLLLALVIPPWLGGCGSLIVTDLTAPELRDRAGFVWATEESDAFVVSAERGTPTAADLPRIATQAEASKRRVLETIGISTHEQRIAVFLVKSRDRMEDLIGRRTNATAFHATNTICLVWPRSGPDGLRHEMVHVIAMQAWGVPERWVNEGVAVDITGPWIGRDLDSVCRDLRDRGALPGVDELTRRFDAWPSAVSYPAAGSFVRSVREAHGLDAVRTIWSGGRRALEQATGRTPAELEAAWLERIDAADPGEGYDPDAATPADDRR